MQISNSRSYETFATDYTLDLETIDRVLITDQIVNAIAESSTDIFRRCCEKHQISLTDPRAEGILYDVRKRLYESLKPIIEPKTEEETKNV